MHAQARTSIDHPLPPNREHDQLAVRFPQKRIVQAFAFLSACLLTISLLIDIAKYKTEMLAGIGSFSRLLPMFDVDMEGSFATFLSALMLLSCAALSFLVSRLDAAERARRWIGVCLLFVILALDEAVMLHEASVKLPLAMGTLALLVTGPHRYPRFLLTIPRTTLALLVTGGVVFLLGAIGMDELSRPYHKEFGMDNFGYRWRATVEETLEMAGIVLFTAGLVHQLSFLGVAEMRMGTSKSAPSSPDEHRHRGAASVPQAQANARPRPRLVKTDEPLQRDV